MDEIYKALGLAILALISAAILKNRSTEIAHYVPQITAVAIVISGVITLSPIISYFKELINERTDQSDTLNILLKAAGVAIISKTVSDICTQNNEPMLKNAIEFASNSEILLLSFPLIKELISVTMDLLKI